MHERAFGTRAIKSTKMNAENPKRRGKQAKFKGTYFVTPPIDPSLLLLSIRSASIIHWHPKSAVWGLHLCTVCINFII
nr:hypothetical protein [uncultured Campylobacter sp.]